MRLKFVRLQIVGNSSFSYASSFKNSILFSDFFCRLIELPFGRFLATVCEAELRLRVEILKSSI